MSTPKQIFLIDDHPLMQEGLTRLIEQGGIWKVCGCADTSASALQRVPLINPDLVTMDVSLPDKNGLELMKDLLALMPDLKILVFSMHDEILYAERVMRAGAKGYLMKGESASNLVKAIDSILGGGIYLSPKASTHLLKNLRSGKARGALGMDCLSDRELEIFELIGLGKGNSQIASQLNISSKTVDAHRANIKTKLDLPDASSLMRAAVLWIERGSSPSVSASPN